jgi:hypothetical protein
MRTDYKVLSVVVAGDGKAIRAPLLELPAAIPLHKILPL